VVSLTSSLNPITVNESNTARATFPHGAVASTERVGWWPSVEVVAFRPSSHTREKQDGIMEYTGIIEYPDEMANCPVELHDHTLNRLI
jgi:hypothetical protein